MNTTEIINSIPLSDSDKFLTSIGFSMIKENLEFIEEARFDKKFDVYDLATGGGRMTALLTRLGFNIITGDISFELKKEAEERIAGEYLKHVRFMNANLENLPYESNSVYNLVSANTFHHLENPEVCLNELTRVQAKGGKFLLIDFTDKGFDLMDEHNQKKHGRLHPRGSYSWDEVGGILKENYTNVKEINRTITRAFIADQKR